MHKSHPVAVLLAALTLSACASTTINLSANGIKTATSPFIGELKVQRYEFENGLKLLVVEDHSSPTFAYHTWFKVGSGNEEPGRTGLAHLFEHMMFKGTTLYPEGKYDSTLEAIGVEDENAFTSNDYTAYVQELPIKASDKGLPVDTLELITKLESDRMVNLVVDEKSFKTEVEVVQNERRSRNENSPDGLIYQAIFELAYKQHPYHWPVIGYEQDLRGMKAQDAVDFYRANYNPARATIIISGDVNPARAAELVQKYYGALKSPRQNKMLDAVLSPEPEQKSPRRQQLKLNIQTQKLSMAYHIPPVDHEHTAALWMLQYILGEGRSSRLQRALVDSGIASTMNAETEDLRGPSLFVFNVNLQKGKSATLAESVILKELERLSRSPVTAEEMVRARNNLTADHYKNLSSNSGKARFLGRYETLFGGFERALEIYKQIAKLSANDIQNVAQLYLKPQSRSLVTGVSK